MLIIIYLVVKVIQREIMSVNMVIGVDVLRNIKKICVN